MQTVFNKKMVLVESEVHCWFLYQKIERWILVNGNISFRPKWWKEIMFLSAFPLATLQFTEKRKEKPGTRHCGISYNQVNYQSHKLTLSGTPFSSSNSFPVMGFPGEIFKRFQ